MLFDIHRMMSELLTEAMQSVADTKNNNPYISNKDLMQSIASYWELLCDDERKELFLHTIKVSATKV
jgi:hypothetical protein